MPDKTERIKRQFIKDVQALAKKLGRTPKKLEYEHGKSAEYYFGAWNNFLAAAGLEPLTYQNYFVNMTDDELLDVVKTEIERIGSTLAHDYSKNRSKQAPSRYYLEKCLGLTWNQVLKRLNFKPNVRRLTGDELMQQLTKLGRELGRTPTTHEARDAGLNISLYDVRFGGYNNALKLSGLDTNFEKETVTHNNDELLEMYVDLCDKLGKAATTEDIDNYLKYSPSVFELRFGSINNLRKMAGYERYEKRSKYSKDSIKKMLIETYKKHGRRLTNKEIEQLSKANDNFPSITTICRHFKTTKMSDVWREVEREL